MLMYLFNYGYILHNTEIGNKREIFFDENNILLRVYVSL